MALRQVFLLLTLVVWSTVFYAYWFRQDRIQNWIPVVGQVVAVEGRSLANVVFMDERGQTTANILEGKYRVGEKISMVHEPGRPDHYFLPESSFAGFWMIMGSCGAVFVSFMTGIIWWCQSTEQQETKRLSEQGRRIWARVVLIEKEDEDSANPDAVFYRLEAVWKDPRTGEVHCFEANELPCDPSAYLPRRKEVQVMVDPDDLSLYRVNLSFLPSD